MDNTTRGQKATVAGDSHDYTGISTMRSFVSSVGDRYDTSQNKVARIK